MCIVGWQRSWPLHAGSLPQVQVPSAPQLSARAALQGTQVLPPIPHIVTERG
jgi:hypothetical protein